MDRVYRAENRVYSKEFNVAKLGFGRRVATAALAAALVSGWMGGAAMGGEGERMIRKEIVVNATPAKAWWMWSTSDGVMALSPPKAKIDLRVGGMYEWYFVPDAPEGQRGSEGCTILSYIPEKMIAFTWNAPPSIKALRDAQARTQVIVEFEPIEAGRTLVRLTQLGFGTGADWDAYYAYFDRAWGHVLGNMEKHFQKDGDSAGKSKYIYFISPSRPGFMQQPTKEEQRLVGEHYQYLKNLFEEGVVQFAGRAMDPAALPTGVEHGVIFEMPACGIIVFEADSLEAARGIMENDPAVKAGVFKGKAFAFGVAFDK